MRPKCKTYMCSICVASLPFLKHQLLVFFFLQSLDPMLSALDSGQPVNLNSLPPPPPGQTQLLNLLLAANPSRLFVSWISWPRYAGTTWWFNWFPDYIPFLKCTLDMYKNLFWINQKRTTMHGKHWKVCFHVPFVIFYVYGAVIFAFVPC